MWIPKPTYHLRKKDEDKRSPCEVYSYHSLGSWSPSLPCPSTAQPQWPTSARVFERKLLMFWSDYKHKSRWLLTYLPNSDTYWWREPGTEKSQWALQGERTVALTGSKRAPSHAAAHLLLWFKPWSKPAIGYRYHHVGTQFPIGMLANIAFQLKLTPLPVVGEDAFVHHDD